jgi:rubrerythrin
LWAIYFRRLHGRRSRAGRCPLCNYNREGLASGAVCPECGASPT